MGRGRVESEGSVFRVEGIALKLALSLSAISRISKEDVAGAETARGREGQRRAGGKRLEWMDLLHP